MMHAKYRLFNLLPILLGLIFFVWSQPYYVWHINHLLRAAISVIAGIIMYLNSNYKSSKYFVLFFVLLFYLSIAGGSNIFGVILAVLMVFVLSLKSDLLQRSFFAFYNIYTFITLLSILNFIFLAIGISIPSKTIEALNPEFDYTFTAYPFMVIADNLALFRFRGVYEEPGNLGTMAIFLLGINKFKFDNWKSYVIFISGILSLSLFFYLSMVVVFSIKIITSRNFKLAIVSLFILSASVIYIANTDNDIIQMAIMDRLEYDQEKGFAGNNRSTDALRTYYNEIKWNSPIFYFGKTLSSSPEQFIDSITLGSASYQSAILKFGLIGLLFYIFFFLKYAWINIEKRRDYIIFFIFFFLILYQRPFVLNSIYITLFIAWIRLADVIQTTKTQGINHDCLIK